MGGQEIPNRAIWVGLLSLILVDYLFPLPNHLGPGPITVGY